MKKLIALLLALTLVVAFAGCGNTAGSNNGTTVEAVDALTAIKTLVNAYNTQYEGTDFQLPIVGGGYETMNWEGPDAVPTEDTAFLTQQLLVPETELSNIKSAASAMHSMNTNIFCAGSFNLVEGADYAAFAAGVKAAILGNRWMCGFPEKLVIANVGDCLIVVYGNAQIVENFNTVIAETYSSATVLYNEAIEA